MKIFNKKTLKWIVQTIIYLVLISLLCIVIIQKFSNNKMSFFGYKIFRVASSSMVPEYNINDILLVKEKDVSEIYEGDDLVYLVVIEYTIKAPITHRVIKIETEENGSLIFHTKGIANTREDPIVREEQIYGVVISKMYLLSILNKIVNNMFGFILLVFIPLIVLIYKNIRELISISKEKKDE